MAWAVIGDVTYAIDAGEVSMGRSSNCDIVLEDDLASRNHATILSNGNTFTLRDNDSRNGTLINGTRLFGSTQLTHLDQIVIGHTQIVFYEEKPAAIQPRGSAVAAKPLTNEDEDTQATATRTGNLVVGALVSKSLDASDLITAERIVQNLAQRLTLSARDRTLVLADLSACSDIIMRYADTARDGRWVEWILNIHATVGAVPSRYSVDVICALGGEGGLKSPDAPRRWLAAVAPMPLTAEQKFLVSRIQSLERQLSA